MPYLLRDIDHEGGIDLDFFNEAISRFDEDETIEPLFTKAMVDISAKLSTMNMNDDYKPYLNVSLEPA
jgi:ubiquitin conjugation factor E4 B